MATILIADDDEVLRKIIRKFLEKDGHAIIEASNGNEVLDVFQHKKIDVAILDVVMPDKGGIETLLEMSCSEIEAKVILITGIVDTETEVFQNLCKQFKAQYIIQKPFEREKLLETVNALLAKNPA